MIILLFQLCFSITIRNKIPGSFTLATQEYNYLTLSTYFQGDSLNYTISPITPNIILSNLRMLQSSPLIISSNFQKPWKNRLLLPVCELSDLYCGVFIYGASTMLTLYDYSNTLQPQGYTFSIIFSSTILLYSLASGLNQFVLIIISDSLTLSSNPNELYISSITRGNLSLQLTQPLRVDTSEYFNSLDPLTLGLSTGKIYETFIATGFNQSTGVILLFTVINDSTIIEAPPLFIVSTDLVKQPMLTVTSGSFHYVLISEQWLIIEIIKSDDGKIELSNALLLDLSNIQVCSMEISHDLSNIIIGVSNGFIIVSTDFMQIFRKSLPIYNESTYVTSTPANYFILAPIGGSLNIFILDTDEFYIIGQFSIMNSNDTEIAWGVFTEILSSFTLIYSQGNILSYKKMVYIGASLNFTCDYKSVEYTLIARDGITGNQVSQSFVLNQLYYIGVIETLNNLNTVVAKFDNYDSTVSIGLYDYFSGFDFVVQDVNVAYIENVNYFKYNYSHQPWFSLLEVIEFNSSDLNCNRIAVGIDSFSIYNSTTAYFNIDSELKLVFNSPIAEIADVTYFSPGFVLRYSENNNSFAILIDLLNNSCLVQMDPCVKVMADTYFICQLPTSIKVFNLDSSLCLILYGTLENDLNNNTIAYTDFYVYYDNDLLIAIGNQTTLYVYNILVLSPTNYPLLNRTLTGVAKNVFLTKSKNVLIVYEDNFLEVYSVSLQYEHYLPLGQYDFISLENDLIFISSNSTLYIKDPLAFVKNSQVAEFPLKNCINFSIFELNFDQTVLYILGEDKVTEYFASNISNSIQLDFNIVLPEEVSKISYTADVEIILANRFGTQTAIVPILLFINGQTIYKNQSAINVIQSNSLKMACNTQLQINLDNIFWGQDLEVNISSVNKDERVFKAVSVNHRFSVLNNTYQPTNITYNAFISISDHELYVLVVHCKLMIYNSLSKIIASFEYDFQEFCIYSDIVSIYSNEYIMFAVGCTINRISLNNSTDFIIPEYFLVFIKFDFNMIELMNNVSVPYPIQKLKAVKNINGEFLITARDVYSEVLTSGFYCNHLQIISGIVFKEYVDVYCMKYVTPEEFNLNYYYIADFDGVYDPMFEMYYIYALNINFGIHIIEIADLSENSITNITNVFIQSTPVSLVRCGEELFVSLDDTVIFKYFLTTWQNPSLTTIIFPYKNIYYAIPGTLKCSDKNYSKYLLLLMLDDLNSVYVHIIDNTAAELASIITDKFIYELNQGNFGIFFNSTTVALLSPLNFSLYALNEYVLNIDTSGLCNGAIFTFNVTAFNQNIEKLTTALTLTVLKNFNPGSVDATGIPGWVWAIIGLFAIVLAYIAFKIARRLPKRRRKNNKDDDIELFNYEFMEIK